MKISRAKTVFYFFIFFFLVLPLTSTAYAAIPTGEILNLDFEEGAGPIAYDHSGRGNHATLGANVQWVAGKNGGGAVRTNGTDTSILTIIDNASLNLTNMDFSISFDMRPMADYNLITEDKYIMRKRVANTTGWTVHVSKYGSPIKPLYCDLADGTTRNSAYVTAKPWYIGYWTNVLVAYNAASKTMNIYRDGILKTTKELSTLNSTTTAIEVATDLILFKGMDAEFDNINIFNREITTSAEITGLAYGGAYSQQVYYVATTGSDANTGKIDSPFATIALAAKIALPGDTIRIKGGVYEESGIIFNESGLPGHPIKIEKYDGDVLLQGSDEPFCFSVSKNHITFTGLNFKGYQKAITCSKVNNIVVENCNFENISQRCLDFSDCSKVTVDNVNISNSSGRGVVFYTLQEATLSNITIDQVDCGMQGYYLQDSTIDHFNASNSSLGLHIAGGTGNTITNFCITNMTGDGITLSHNNQNTIVENGYIEDTGQHGLHIWTGAYNITVKNVTFWDNWHNQLDLHNGVKKAVIEGCHFGYHDNEWLTGDVVSIYLHNFNIEDITIKNNEFNYARRPIEIFNTRNLTVTNNTFRNIQKPDNTALGRWLLIGSVGDETPGGPDNYAERGLINATFSNNIIYGPNDFVIAFVTIGENAGFPLGAAETYCQDVTFSNNLHSGIVNNYFILDAKTRLKNVSIDDLVQNNQSTALVYRGFVPLQAENVSLSESIAEAYPLNQTFAFSIIPDVPVSYPLTVTNGTGSGSYSFGQKVTIAANTPPQGKIFDRWTGDTQRVSSVTSALTEVTMPASAVSLTATYKSLAGEPGGTGGGGTEGTGGSNAGGNSEHEVINPSISGEAGNLPELSSPQKQIKLELKIGSEFAILDGKTILVDVPPIIINNRTMVPLRFIGEGLGATFNWNEETRTVTYHLNDQEIKLVIDQPVAGFDTPPTIINGRTMVPIRCIAELFGAEVTWDPVNRSVMVIE